MTELAADLIAYLLAHYRTELLARYQMEDVGEEITAIMALDHVCENRKCYKKGQEPDYEKAASLFIDDFRSGRIGRITLEAPGQENE
jgi:ribosome biogenesis GTPase A